VVLLVFVLGIGVTGLVLILRLASADRLGVLVLDGRLSAPTGYFNSTAALFTIAALVALALAPRRELPGLVRGALMATACAGLQLALIVQSRGWLFTLPIVIVIALCLVRDRLRVVAFATLPLAGALVALPRLLDVYQIGPGLSDAASRAGRLGLIACVVVFVVGSVAAWVDQLRARPPLAPGTRRALGVGLSVAALGVGCVGGVIATHGHPFRFISRQWSGFSHVQRSSAGSHFGDVGSGRYDFWRVALDAAIAHPIGGLGQDNFADYYIRRRHTAEEPSWTHSLELRLLAHTGFVGLALFAAFVVETLVAIWRVIRPIRDPLGGATAAAALLPLTVWLIHGSVDWFWEVPALSGAALMFLGVSFGLGAAEAQIVPRREARSRLPAVYVRIATVIAVLAGTVVLGFPYIAVREASNAINVASSDPAAALSDLSTAAKLNPLSPIPGRLAGRIALGAGEYEVARERFAQAISREPGGWFAWFGSGLAASQLGYVAEAKHDFLVAHSINREQPAIREALIRVDTDHPMSAADGLRALVLAQ
jgi:hypothetical protein